MAKSDTPRVGKKLGEDQSRSIEDILASVGNENFGELVNGIFEGAKGAKEFGKRIGQSSRIKNLPRRERLEVQKLIANLAINHARMNPSLGSEELARLKDEQILLMLRKEFALVPLTEEIDDPSPTAEMSQTDLAG